MRCRGLTGRRNPVRSHAGPLVDVLGDPLLRDVTVGPNLAKANLSQTTAEAFSSLAAAPIDAAVNVNTLMGFVCDVECVMDANRKPLSISRFRRLGKNSTEVAQLPAGAQR